MDAVNVGQVARERLGELLCDACDHLISELLRVPGSQHGLDLLEALEEGYADPGFARRGPATRTTTTARALLEEISRNRLVPVGWLEEHSGVMALLYLVCEAGDRTEMPVGLLWRLGYMLKRLGLLDASRSTVWLYCSREIDDWTNEQLGVWLERCERAAKALYL